MELVKAITKSLEGISTGKNMTGAIEGEVKPILDIFCRDIGYIKKGAPN